MIGYIQGKIIFSDGAEVIIVTDRGIGYQIYYKKVLPEGCDTSLFVSHLIRDNGEDLYGFSCLREKKLFEMLIQVKGVGPKSAYSLLFALGMNAVIEAISLEDKKILSKAPGVGAKSAAQIVLDLSHKIHKIRMYSERTAQIIISPDKQLNESLTDSAQTWELQEEVAQSNGFNVGIMDEAIMACKELGFSEERMIPLAQDILRNNHISKAEQLVHLILKGI